MTAGRGTQDAARVKVTKELIANNAFEADILEVGYRVREGVTRSAEEIVTELWEQVFGRVGSGDDEGKAVAPTGGTSSR